MHNCVPYMYRVLEATLSSSCHVNQYVLPLLQLSTKVESEAHWQIAQTHRRLNSISKIWNSAFPACNCPDTFHHCLKTHCFLQTLFSGLLEVVSLEVMAVSIRTVTGTKSCGKRIPDFEDVN